MTSRFSEENITTGSKKLQPKYSIPIQDLIVNNGISKTKMSEKSGVYIFWWNKSEEFEKRLKDSEYRVKAKKSHDVQMVTIQFSQEWIQKATVGDKICLYVGKTTNLRKRISQHLKLRSEEKLDKAQSKKEGRKPNTISQIRIALETVFDKGMLEEIKENVSVSRAEMDKYCEATNRFFLEDKMISQYYPLFNIDVER